MESTRGLNNSIIITGLAASLLTGLLDVMIGLVSAKSLFLIFNSILLPLAVTTLITFICFISSWLLIGKRIVKSYKSDPSALAISFGVFIGTVIILFSLNYYSILEAAYLILFIKIGIIFLISFAALLITYFAAKKIQTLKTANQIGNTIAFLLPILLFELLFFLWLNVFSKITVFVTSLGFVTLAILTCFLYFSRYNKIQTTNVLAIIFLVILFCGPIVFFVKDLDSRPSSEPRNLSSEHRVNNIILISIDTLRTDVLSSYGSSQVSTPNIDQIANDGHLFTNAYSPAPWTLPSVASIMTGLSPEAHTTTNLDLKLPDAITTLSERMFDSGYITAAIGENLFLHRDFNIDQGFMEYNFYPKRKKLVDSFGGAIIYRVFPNYFKDEADTSYLTDLTINWLRDNNEQDFFLWVHYYDPHLPYNPPTQYLVNKNDSVTSYGLNTATEIRGGSFTPSPEEKKEMKRLYDAEVRYVDDNIGRIIKELEELDLYDDSLIIITSDHGEEFWDHGQYEHSHSLYNELIKVPLIIKLPNKREGNKIETAVSIQSIMATILELSGLNYDDRYISSSLVPLLQNNEDEYREKPVVSSNVLLYENREAAIFDGKKYIRTINANDEEFYDLENDPNEKNPISSSLVTDNINHAKQILEQHKNESRISTRHYGAVIRENVVLDEEKKEKLKSLGYMQ